MRFDVNNVQPLRIFPQKMRASTYNTIRLGILRIADPLILTLQNKPNIKCYLYRHKWIVVDTILEEFPLVVWRNFSIRNRSIHEPVDCQVYVYHMMAGRLMGTALYDIEEQLDQILHENVK